jgi:hypothetical protein
LAFNYGIGIQKPLKYVTGFYTNEEKNFAARAGGFMRPIVLKPHWPLACDIMTKSIAFIP